MRGFAIALLVIITFIWGSTFIVVKNAIAHIPPFVFVSFRFIIAAILLIPFMIRRGNKITISEVMKSIITGSALFGGYAFQTLGLLYTTASKSAFITSLSVVLVPFVSYLIFRRKPGAREIAALGMAVIGLYQLILGPRFKFEGINLGDAFTFFCALSFALHISLTGHFTKSVNIESFTLNQFLYVGIISFIFSLIFGEKITGLSGNPLFALIFIGVFATAFAFVGQTWAQRHIKDTQAALIFSLEPVFAVLFAILFGGEILTTNQIIGGSLIIGGILISEW